MRTQEDGTPFQKVICKNEYKTYMLSGTRGTEILLKLSRMYLPSVGVVIDEVFTPKNEGKDNVGDFDISFTDIAKEIVKKMDTGENLQIIKSLVEPCTRNGKQVDFDYDFRGKYMELFQVIAWTIELNFGDFFLSSLKEKFTSLSVKGKRKSSSRSPST